MHDPNEFQGTRIKSFFERVQEAGGGGSNTNSPSASLGSSNNTNTPQQYPSPSTSWNNTPTSSGNFNRQAFGTSALQLHLQQTSPSAHQLQQAQQKGSNSSPSFYSHYTNNQNNNNNNNNRRSNPNSATSSLASNNNNNSAGAGSPGGVTSSSKRKNNNNNRKKQQPPTISVIPLSEPPEEESPSSLLPRDLMTMRYDSSLSSNDQQLEVLQTLPAQISPSTSTTTTTTTSATTTTAASLEGNNTNNNSTTATTSHPPSTPLSQNFFSKGPIPSSVIAKHFQHRNLKYVKQLGDRLHLGQKIIVNNNNNNSTSIGDLLCSYVLTMQEASFGHQLKEQYRTESRHPGSVVVISAIRHSDGIVEVETEYCDIGPVERLYQYLDKPDYRHHAMTTAKSVARQALIALQTFNVVHSKVHRAVSSRTVLCRRDGCVKLGIFDAITREDFNISSSYANQFLQSPFCAPECRPSPYHNSNSNSNIIGKNFSGVASAPLSCVGNNNNNNNCATSPSSAYSLFDNVNTTSKKDNNDSASSSSSDFFAKMTATALQTTDRKTVIDHFFKFSDSSKADVWSIGVLILSILLKDSFFPNNHTAADTSDENCNNNNNNIKIFNDLVFGRNNEELWCKTIPDASVRYLTRRCLEIDPRKRISLNDAVALTFIFGRTQGFRRNAVKTISDANLVKKETETIPPWARYTECPFATPDHVPSDNDDDNENNKEGLLPQQNSSASLFSASLPASPEATKNSNNSKKPKDEVPLKDILASRHLSKLLDEETIDDETKFLSSLHSHFPSSDDEENNNNNKTCREGEVEGEAKNEEGENNTHNNTKKHSNYYCLSEIINKHTRRVSTLLDLELRSQLTKRLDHPNGISHIEKQMREVMKTRVYPAMRCLRAIVSDISVIRKQTQQSNKK